jgi:hypothetical protein
VPSGALPWIGAPSRKEAAMTTLQPESKPASRRALLASALGGIGALLASAIGRASPVRAANGDVVHVGDTLTATGTTRISNLTTTNAVLVGQSSSGIGVTGTSTSYYGMLGSSGSFVGVYGGSSTNIGVYGQSAASDHAATVGFSEGDSTGVQGYSGISLPAPRPKTGVYGYAGQDSTSKGVFGESPAGYAGFFLGKVYLSTFQEMAEISTPVAPAANKARLFVRDNGSGKTQLCVRFPTGAVQVIKTEP